MNSALRVVVVDDEQLAREELCYQLEQLDGIQIVAQASNGIEALGAVVDTTPWQERELAATLARVQPSVVFALLGTTRRRMRESGSHDSYESVDYGLTAMLLRAVRTSAPDARFVYLSAIGVGPKGRGSYMHVRWRLEHVQQGEAVPA